ncbi:MAG TPA: hypothetical protein VHE30_24545 [Polyangiaceae bacterium]|nr:hypothetical protein [Polyangiaceae bacterium]
MSRAEARRSTTRPSWLARGTAFGSTAGTFVLAALVPKCPLCVAAMLSAWGVGASVAGTVAPVVRPALLVLTVAAVLAVGVVGVRSSRNRRRRAESQPSCCSG